MFPKFTAPLAKALRTSEGVLVYVLNAALAAGTIIEPSKLPPKEAAIVAAAVTGAHLAARTLLKVVAVQKSVGLGEPEHVNVADEVKGLLEHHAGVHQAQLQQLTGAISAGLSNLNAGLAQHVKQAVSEIAQAADRPISALDGTLQAHAQSQQAQAAAPPAEGRAPVPPVQAQPPVQGPPIPDPQNAAAG